MADYFVEGNKTVYCKEGHPTIVPFQTTVCKCSHCKDTMVFKFFGVIKDKHDNYVF